MKKSFATLMLVLVGIALLSSCLPTKQSCAAYNGVELEQAQEIK